MRKALYLSILAATFITACQSEQEKKVETQRTSSIDEFIRIPTDNGNVAESEMAKIEFEETVYYFDTIMQDEKIDNVFKFKNTGKQPLKIADVTSNCGCTVPYYPEKVIEVGEQGEIKVIFDSEGKSGEQDKKISIFANTYPNETVLHMRGFVNDKKE